jgi:spore maturation protein CgeB
MPTPFSGLRIVFVAPVDDAELAHNALRRRALERLGAVLLHVDPERAGWLARLVRRDLDQRLGAAIEEHHPDLVIVAGDGMLAADSVDALRRGRRARWIQLLGDELIDAAGASREAMAFDFVFVGASGALRSFDRHGVKHAHYLALGCDPSVHKPLSARGPFRANVVFAGAATPRRERFLVELVEFGLALWGPGWRKTTLRDYCRGELPSTEDFVRAYAGATVAVNVHRTGANDKVGDGTGVNRRTFEIAAIGVPQVVDLRADLARHFEEGSELLVYNTAEELKGQVKRAIQEDTYRERLASGARQHALREHTYMHRMHTMLQTVTGNGPAAAH